MCVYIAAEVAKGLDHAHRRRDEQMRPLGIVHRDVSPQNILLSWEGEVKVTDFGIAKARTSLEPAPEGETAKTQTDEASGAQLQGKYSYMSPEQARGEAVDARSDLFSLGTVLYEMLTGVNPFRAPTMFETLRRVKAGEYPPIEVVRQDLPSGLGVLLERALSPLQPRRDSPTQVACTKVCSRTSTRPAIASARAICPRSSADSVIAFRRASRLSQVTVAEDTSEPTKSRRSKSPANRRRAPSFPSRPISRP